MEKPAISTTSSIHPLQVMNNGEENIPPPSSPPIFQASSTLKPSSSAPPKSPESTLQQSDSDVIRPDSESIEANMKEPVLITTSRVNLSSALASSSEIFPHSHVKKKTSKTRISYSSSHDSLNNNPQILHSAAESETTNDPQQPEAESRNKFLHIMEIVDEQDLGKHLLGLAIALGIGLVNSASALVKTTEIHNIVVITLSLAIALLWNGLLLRKTFIKTSTFILLSGAALMMLSFYSLLAFYLPIYLIWIPVLCGLASLIPLAIYAWTYFRAAKTNEDPEIQ